MFEEVVIRRKELRWSSVTGHEEYLFPISSERLFSFDLNFRITIL